MRARRGGLGDAAAGASRARGATASRSSPRSPTSRARPTSSVWSRRALGGLGSITILVNNAGIYGPKGPVAENDWDDWIRAVEINLLRIGAAGPRAGGAFRPARLRQDRAALRWRRDGAAAGPERLCGLEGGRGPLCRDGGPGVARSQRRCQRDRSGRAQHEAARRDPRRGPGTGGPRLLRPRPGAARLRGGSAAAGSRSRGLPGLGASDGITGKLLSAVWDPWSELRPTAPIWTPTSTRYGASCPRDRELGWGDEP